MTSVDWPTYRVLLHHEGRSRLDLLKLIRARRPCLSLADAKALIEPMGQAILIEVPHLELDRVRRDLDRLGAYYEVVRNEAG